MLACSEIDELFGVDYEDEAGQQQQTDEAINYHIEGEFNNCSNPSIFTNIWVLNVNECCKCQ